MRSPPVGKESQRLFSSMFGARGPSSTLHFLVHTELPELRREAAARGWLERGYSALTVPWMELHWTSDGWRTQHVVSSSDVPCPVVSGTFHLAGCAPATEVEFAIRVGLACHAPTDTAGARDVGELWLNNNGQNYRQVTK